MVMEFRNFFAKTKEISNKRLLHLFLFSGTNTSTDVIELRLCHVIQKGASCQAETAAENTHAVQLDDVAQPHN